MSLQFEIIEGLKVTTAGKTWRQYLIRSFNRTVRLRWVRVAQLAAKAVEKIPGEVALIAGALGKRALDLYAVFLKKYSFIAKLSQEEWADAIATLINRGSEQDLRALRGIIVERFVPSMDQLADLMTDLTKLASGRKGWGAAQLVSGVRTPAGREVADWMVVSVHEDGRIWLMAIIESKSISNTKDLVAHKGTEMGQHLWDIFRAKSEGIVLTKVEGDAAIATAYNPKAIVAEIPPHQGATDGFYTRFIGVIPRDFTTGEINRLAIKGIGIEQWSWPVDQKKMMDMINELIDALSK
jgi:hypothetical protein